MAHTCHAPYCEIKVPPSKWGCAKHWFMLSKDLRDNIWAMYRAGQERDKEPTLEYMIASYEAQKFIVEKEKVFEDWPAAIAELDETIGKFRESIERHKKWAAKGR